MLTLSKSGALIATPFPVQDSAMLRQLARADGLILRPPHAAALAAGATVPILRLDAIVSEFAIGAAAFRLTVAGEPM